MKKFITFVPMQTRDNLLSKIYTADFNQKLQTDFPIHFPITAIINGYAEAGEEIEILAIVEKDNADCRQNLDLLSKEINEIATKNGFRFSIRTIAIEKEEAVSAHLQTFSNLIEAISDNDILYACITFGTKPTPIIEMMALNFAYKVKQNVSIDCIAYGKVNRKDNQAISYYIYDVTALFFMNEIVNTLAEGKEKNPEHAIKQILRLGNE